MEEDQVKQKLPEIYESIIKTEEEVDFSQIKEDLEDLSWLKLDEMSAEEAIISVWKVADRWGVSVLQQSPRFRLLKITKIKIPITNYMYSISSSPNIKQICLECQSKLEDMIFFQCAKTLLYSASDENFPDLVTRVNNTYSEIKSNITSFFLHFDKVLKAEMNSSLSSLMDSVFHSKVLKHFSDKMSTDNTLKKILSEYEDKKQNLINSSSSPSISTSTSVSGASQTYPSGYTITYTQYPSDHSSWSRENLYRGEVSADNKREGWGKVNYFGGDSYEGNWKNDKPEGLGLYIWKTAGRYLGEFSKGLPCGQGERVYSSGNYYKGAFVNGKKHGHGVMSFKNGDVYEGMWEEDDMNGQGKYSWATGDTFIGKFVKGTREGPGSLHLVTHEVIEGNWKDNFKTE